MKRVVFMVLSFLLLLLMVFVTACADTVTDTVTSTVTSTATSTATSTVTVTVTVTPTATTPDGSALFQERCAVCHGTDYTGDVGPDLLDHALTRAQIEDAIKDGGLVMPPWADILTDEDLQALLDELEELS